MEKVFTESSRFLISFYALKIPWKLKLYVLIIQDVFFMFFIEIYLIIMNIIKYEENIFQEYLTTKLMSFLLKRI